MQLPPILLKKIPMPKRMIKRDSRRSSRRFQTKILTLHRLHSLNTSQRWIARVDLAHPSYLLSVTRRDLDSIDLTRNRLSIQTKNKKRKKRETRGGRRTESVKRRDSWRRRKFTSLSSRIVVRGARGNQRRRSNLVPNRPKKSRNLKNVDLGVLGERRSRSSNLNRRRRKSRRSRNRRKGRKAILNKMIESHVRNPIVQSSNRNLSGISPHARM